MGLSLPATGSSVRNTLEVADSNGIHTSLCSSGVITPAELMRPAWFTLHTWIPMPFFTSGVPCTIAPALFMVVDDTRWSRTPLELMVMLWASADCMISDIAWLVGPVLGAESSLGRRNPLPAKSATTAAAAAMNMMRCFDRRNRQLPRLITRPPPAPLASLAPAPPESALAAVTSAGSAASGSVAAVSVLFTASAPAVAGVPESPSGSIPSMAASTVSFRESDGVTGTVDNARASASSASANFSSGSQDWSLVVIVPLSY